MTHFLRKKIAFFLLLLFLPMTVIQCTSSEEDSTVLEEELDDIDGASLEDEVEDLGEDDEFTNADSEDDEEDFSEDEEGFDDEFDEFSEDDEFADIDEDDEFDEFEDLDNETSEEEDQFAQNEEALKKELEKNNQNYPVAQDAEAQFPEEVIGAESVTSAEPVVDAPMITSETQEPSFMDPIEPSIPQDDLGLADPIVPLGDDERPPAPSWIPVVKVKTDPFFRNNRLMNAVYIVRPDDSMASISQKIYSGDRVDEINSDNPHLAKGIDPGDKIYYNSPNRPNDRSSLKFYYDDIGLRPQTYRTVANDNIRRLGVKLLGFGDGWKEIWATNPNIDSKTILPSGMEIQYWTGNEPSVHMAMNEVTTSEELPPSDPQPMETENFEEPPPVAEPLPEDSMAMGQVKAGNSMGGGDDLPPEPPLPEAEVALDPTLEPEPIEVPPMPEPRAATPAVIAQANQQDSSLLTLGAIALLVMASAGLVAIQIKKRKSETAATPASLEYTQV